MVASRASITTAGDGIGGASRHGSVTWSAKQRRSPARTTNRARSTPLVGLERRRRSRGWPGSGRRACATPPDRSSRTSGVVSPYSGRTAISTSSSTSPSMPFDDATDRGGRMTTDVVVHVVGVQRHEVGEDDARRSRCAARCAAPSCRRRTRGATRSARRCVMLQEPPGSPRMRANTAGESNAGRHAQSIEPSRDTSAEPWQFDSSA